MLILPLFTHPIFWLLTDDHDQPQRPNTSPRSIARLTAVPLG
jgi:hypothetical protein